ncbi:MAG TPA: cupin domain-containing protein [Trinickia sp.]|nr:cupin domain-containing protein [Trinickia sp.]
MKDVLSDILDTIELKGALYFRTDFSPPFAIGVPADGKAARFRHVTVPGGVELLLQPSDLLMCLRGTIPNVASRATRRPSSSQSTIGAACSL